MTQPTTYTSNTLTPQASQMQSLINSITSMPAGSAPSPQAVSSAQATALPAYNSMQSNQGQNQQNVQQQLTQQTVSPLMQQYSSYIPAFQMYQADTQLAQKYMNNTNPNIYANSGVMNSAMSNPANVQGIADPYMADPASIAASIIPAPAAGGGFAGYSDPQSAIAASNVPIQGVQTMLNTLNDAINSQTGRVNTAMSGYNANYGSTMNAMGQLVNYLSSQGGVGSPGYNQTMENQVQSDVKNGMTLQDLLLKYRAQVDPNSIYGIYNTIHSTDTPGAKGSAGWGTAKQTAEQLAQLGITGAPITQTAAGEKTSYQSKKLPDGTIVNYEPKTGKYYDPNTGKQLTLTSDAINAATQVSNTATAMMNNFESMNPALRAATLVPGVGDMISHIDPAYAQAQSALFQSLGALRKGAIGGRITQQEISWLTAKLFPQAGDTNATMQAKVDALNQKVQMLISTPEAYVASDGNVYGGTTTQTSGTDPAAAFWK